MISHSHPLQGRLALITGASRGLGKAAALALARAGAHVILLAKTRQDLEAVDDEIQKVNEPATLLSLDLQNGEAIDALGPTIYDRWGKLDIFIANAAILGPLSPLHHITADHWQHVIDINLTANWRLVRTLDPVLKKSDAGRAIFISSGASRGKYAYWGPYAVSKAGLETLANTYAAECENTSLKVVTVNPGAMRTRMRAKAFPGEDPLSLPTPDEVAPILVELAAPHSEHHGVILDYKDWRQKKNLEKQKI